MEDCSEKIRKLGLILSKKYMKIPTDAFGEIAKSFAKFIKGGQTVLFFGDLGSGKTTFVRYMMAACGVNPAEVRSPTFNIVNTYQSDEWVFYHIDVYRITSDELFDLGFNDYQRSNSILLIEWAEKIVDEIDPPDYLIQLEINKENMKTRDIYIYEPGVNKNAKTNLSH